MAEAIGNLPPEFQEKLDNIDVVVQDWPTRRQLASVRMRSRWQLLGLYEGVPLTTMGKAHATTPPDKITIFQRPIEMAYRTEKRIVYGIGDTVYHEIAHHFGISDEKLRQISRQRRKGKDT